MQSKQPRAQHAQNSGDDRGLQEKPPCTPPLTIMNSTVTAVESFRFLGTTISQDLKWDIHIDSIVKKAQQSLFFLRQLRKFNLPRELLKQFYYAIIESVLCTSITVWFNSATNSDLRRLPLISKTLPLWTVTIWLTLQRVPERPDTETVSFPKQSISWTLGNNYGTHTIYTLIYLTHILSLHFDCHDNIPLHTKLSIVIYLYIQLSICILLFLIYLFFLLSVFCFFHCHSIAQR